MLPVAAVVLVLRHGGHALEPRDVMFLGVVSGLVFGASEAVHYVVDVYGDVLGRAGALGLVWRLAAAPATHACWAGVAAFIVELAARRVPAKWAPLALLALSPSARSRSRRPRSITNPVNWLFRKWSAAEGVTGRRAGVVSLR